MVPPRAPSFAPNIRSELSKSVVLPSRENRAGPVTGYPFQRAEVAELADALDSKSSGASAPCGFDSHLRHL
jgi:hypothetical protein